MNEYIIRDREAGNFIAGFATLPEAEAALADYENHDREDKTFEPDFYEITKVVKRLRVYRAGMECRANGHEVSDYDYIKSQINYIDSNPELLGEFDKFADAEKLAESKTGSLRLYEFSSAGRWFAFDWIYIEGWNIEYTDNGEVVEEEFDGDIYREYINER